ncbi:hypothetical protein P9239_22795 [Caballeronia sp. LZ062]|uniref:hypothetical protein n=1 Tax=unclassified Caballeronia TaxID=2646786 RepID=UPI00286148F6|nr:MULTISPECIES: hypothetical protein [unclassified Caballeronia]MDR5856514.1 hypothetical protein [Caballeronia sp. LZ050]MDR5873184.1 hypothetical protein [Caballeronia sp. LZ062]
MNSCFHIRVLSGALSGCAEDGIRIQIAPGIYQAYREDDTLTFVDADPRMCGTVTVDLREYADFSPIPDDLTSNGLIEIL